ncbi:LPXTG-motif cell wall anchor domain-containing protein/TQXA domain-containing protein [Clostridium collagenovorans DSM 3089]|uniref:LPXTG-motif cell wall anchor domain-containing protein/TQXA domain-containing protein n=1 Tax=Clostridium collagenovorans DSM 3089 TaxID=1121306 RepID=A0A1M5Y2P9_9CLOT|nr:Cys-Gln thioester bond-forming surface protein [Clostridium collagenovorans]SHI06199.1 LPXTG-motif cell wall anchor domain-containing protein/TQXA domain-containing protein [Clostridium collagenovorans DSM 3089]
MNKLKRIGTYFILVFMVLAITLTGSIKTYAESKIPDKLIVDIQHQSMGKLYYDDFSISANKIVSNIGIGYCLEIDKDYPHGQEFRLKGDCSEAIRNILIAGYPNKSAQELNLDSEKDAYFATQVAIWSVIEGYDVNRFRGGSDKLLRAIKEIYSSSQKSNRGKLVYEAKEYYTNEDTQDIVMLFKSEDFGVPIPPIEPQPPVEPQKPEPPVEPETPKEPLPQTGVEDNIGFIVIGLGAILTGIYLNIHKREA